MDQISTGTSVDYNVNVVLNKYPLTCEHLQKVQWEQSPLAKLEILYNALKFTLPDEVDAFWQGTKKFEAKKERSIDIDTLQAICIYIVW